MSKEVGERIKQAFDERHPERKPAELHPEREGKTGKELIREALEAEHPTEEGKEYQAHQATEAMRKIRSGFEEIHPSGKDGKPLEEAPERGEDNDKNTNTLT